MLVSILGFVVVVMLWLAFGAALMFSSGSVESLWEKFHELPLVAQAIGWLLLLPWIAGAWIWQSSWPVGVRLLLDAGLAVATILAFFPRSG